MTQEVLLDYSNWKGARRWRRVKPINIWFGHTEYHPDDQWLLSAIDLEDNNTSKDFAMADIHEWRPLVHDPEQPKGDKES